MKKIVALFTIAAFPAGLSGCALNFYKGKPEQERQIRKLTSELSEMEEAKRMLEDQLAREIRDKQVLLELAERGLVITLVNEILFDSGKDKLKSESHSVLKKVSSVINEKLPDSNVGIEGYTDNVPIKYSGWKSNWELSSSRATSVLHYLIDECGIAPQKLSAIGYGEYRPITANETKAGRARNRRVEIVVLPKTIAKKSYEEDQARISKEARSEEESRIGEEAIK